MKKYRFITALLLVFCLSFCSVGAFAADKATDDESVTYATGLEVEKWKDIISGKDNGLVKLLSERRRYDVNSDGIVTAADARLCLRMAAGLEENNIPVIQLAAVGESGRTAKASDARTILRVAAKLNKAEATIREASYGANWGEVLGPLKNIDGYTWKHDADSKIFECNELSITEKDGTNYDKDCAGQYFFFKPLAKDGSYTISFRLSDSSDKEVKDSFTVVITIK